MTTRKKAAVKSPRKRAAASRTPRARILLPVSHEERWRMVAEAAYYLAQQRGFAGGDPTADWVAAEAEVDGRLKAEGRVPGTS
jgi:hypothetical protein